MIDDSKRRLLAGELETLAKRAQESAHSGGMASLGRQMLMADSAKLGRAAERLADPAGGDIEQIVSEMALFSLTNRNQVRDVCEQIGVIARPAATHSNEKIIIAGYRKRTK
jgi:hypothetical protein